MAVSAKFSFHKIIAFMLRSFTKDVQKVLYKTSHLGKHHKDRTSDSENILNYDTVKILKFGTPQTIAIIVLKLEKFDVTLH